MDLLRWICVDPMELQFISWHEWTGVHTLSSHNRGPDSSEEHE